MKRYLVVILIIPFLVLNGCKGEKKAWVENLSAAENKEFENGSIPEERIDNLKRGVDFYKNEVERTVKASKQIGIYYRMLALEYMSLEMYNEALKSIESAVEYFPTSPLLYYNGALASAQMSKTVFNDLKSEHYIETAEKYYLKALMLDPGYVEALYGLSVLYIFELDRPAEAEPLLERLLSRSSSRYDAMFLLARVKILMGEVDQAVELYSTIEEGASDDNTRMKAKENRMKIIGVGNG